MNKTAYTDRATSMYYSYSQLTSKRLKEYENIMSVEKRKQGYGNNDGFGY